MVTVSRSVDRVFKVIELFAEKRRPLSTTEVRAALGFPHSSTASVLHRMMALGYLDKNARSKRFFPSIHLSRLCSAVPTSIIGGSPPAKLADAVASAVNETTAVVRLDGFFTHTLYVRAAAHPLAKAVPRGWTGGLATVSVVGRTLLSMLPDDECDEFLRRATDWAQRTRVALPQDMKEIRRSIADARRHGFLFGGNEMLRGLSAAACPLRGLHHDPLAIVVAGASERMNVRRDQIVKALLRQAGADRGGSSRAIADGESRQPTQDVA